jgi:AraC-like DNA-binding protein
LQAIAAAEIRFIPFELVRLLLPHQAGNPMKADEINPALDKSLAGERPQNRTEVEVLERAVQFELWDRGPVSPAALEQLLMVGGPRAMRAALTVALQGRFIVTTASTAVHGLHLLAASRSALVILDVDLPDFTSATFMRALRAHRPHCPVIAIVDAEESTTLHDLMDFRVDIVLRSLPLDVLFGRIDALLGGRPAGSRHLASRVSEVIKHVANHCGGHLVAAAIAKTLGLSTAHLAYLFRLETGMTIRDYVTKVRIEVAKHLLDETDEKLEGIAAKAGFCDASHLSRVFQRVCGYPPGQYRRQAS